MNPISDAVPVTDGAPDPQTPAGAAQTAGSDAFAALLAAAAALGPPPTPGQAEAARTAPAEGTEAGSDSPGSSDSTAATLSASAASQATPPYTPATGSLGEEFEDAAPATTDGVDPNAEASADPPVGAPAPDVPPPAGVEARIPDGENPAAVAYAQKRLGQLVRAGVIERVPDGDPTAAWRELSKDIDAIAERAGYTDPREFLAHGHVEQQPARAQAPTEAHAPAPTTATPAAENGTEIPVSLATAADSRRAAQPEPSAPAAQPVEAVTVRGGSPLQRESATHDGSKRGGERAASAPEPTSAPAAGVAGAPVQVTPAAEREHAVLRPVTARLHELVDKAQATIRIAVREGHTDARITLRPAELGEVKIMLRYEGGGVSALLTADSGKAVDVLTQASADLRRSLEQQGLTVHGLDVRLAGDDARQGAAPWRDGSQPAPTRVGPYGDDDHDQQPEGTEPATRVTEAGRIDVLA